MNVVIWLAAILGLLVLADRVLARRPGSIVLGLVVVLCVVALAEAVLLFDFLERPLTWVIEDVLRLGNLPDDKTKREVAVDLAAGWVRWSLVAAAAIFLLASRLLGRSAWVDVVAGLIVVLVAWSAYEARKHTQKCVKQAEKVCVPPKPNPAIFSVPAERIAPPGRFLGKGTEVVLLMVKPKFDEKGNPIAHETSRHEATLEREVPRRGPMRPLPMTIERGADDTGAAGFVSDLEDATKIHLLTQASK